MIKLSYAGNKPIISPNGISFEGKEDKFEFIEPAAQILKLLLEFNENQKEGKISHAKKMDTKEILKLIQSSINNIENIQESSLNRYLKKLDKENETVDEIPFLKKSEKEIFKKNLSLMREYRIKRAGNKIIYEILIQKIKELIIKKEIKRIKLPFSKRFLHVAESINKSFEGLKNGFNTKLTINIEPGKTPYICFERKI